MRNVPVLVVALALALALGLALVAAAPGAPPAPPLGPPVFVVSGGGYGHGVGMSQYGAHAQALAGRTYRDILAFYYPGTEVAKAPVAKVRVLLVERAATLRVASTGTLRVRDAAGTSVELPAGELTLTPLLELPVDGEPTPLAPPLVLTPLRGAQLALQGAPYRGELRVDVDRDRLRALNVVSLDAYLQGVVPGEMPQEWPLEALKAQAVAARSYAVANLLRGKPFDLYADVRSQVYRGIRGEAWSTTQAVAQTRGEVLSYGGKVATAFYSSSSGGRTASALDAFGLDVPYLPSLDDPWDADSPHHRWPVGTVTAAQVRKALRLPAAVVDVQAEPTLSGRPAVVRWTTSVGATVEVKASDVRFKLGLRSTAFRLGVLRLPRGPQRVEAGTALRLTGVARGVDAPVLERRVGAAWQRAARVAPRADGTFTVRLKPLATTVYRLVAGGVAGPALTVQVLPGPSP